MTSQKLTLAGPLCGRRVELPCRSTHCEHFQCFDAKYYLMMNERKQTWMCPICHNSAPFDTLILDAYFTEILESKKLPKDINEINLHNDATWTPITTKGSGNQSNSSNVNSITVDEDSGVDIEDVDLDSSKDNNGDVECVTIDSDEDSDNEETKSEGSITQTPSKADVSEDLNDTKYSPNHSKTKNNKDNNDDIILSSDDDDILMDKNDDSEGELDWDEIENLAKQDPDFTKSQEKKRDRIEETTTVDFDDDPDDNKDKRKDEIILEAKAACKRSPRGY